MAGGSAPGSADDSAHGWSEPTLDSLARIFATFVPDAADEAPRLARLAADNLAAAADHDELRLLRLALRAVEIPIANWMTARQWGRFSTMDAGRRERLLLAWSTSRVPRLRSSYQVLKRLALFLAYADDGGTPAAPANRLWSGIGYRPAEPVAPRPPAVQVERVDPNLEEALELEADDVVIGSGAGGGVVAARLAAAGRAVLVLEQGPAPTDGELPRGEAAAFRDLYLDRGTTASFDLGVSILAGSGLGGGTTINWTTCLPPPDWLRREWAGRHGLAGFDGPETDEDVARLGVELGLQAPTVVPPKDQLVLDGAAALGWEAALTERNAGPCVDCGSCGFGCRSGSKRSGPRSHLAAAAADGARILADARVERVELAGSRVTGVSGRLAQAHPGGRGRPFRVSARRVVVAAGALRSPLLLERSGLHHPHLGRNLRLHPTVAVAARMPQAVEMWRGPTQAARSLHHLRGTDDGADGFVIESAPGHPGLVASALPWANAASHAMLMAEARLHAPLIGIVRDAGSGRVRWSSGGHPRIDYRLSPKDGAMVRRALIALARLARAGGADRVTVLATPGLVWGAADGDAGFAALESRVERLSGSPNRVTLFSAHQMGTVRAGGDPALHPCDAEGRVRTGADGGTVAGLYVADASLAPSAAGVNPMLTVMALAERTARAVLADRA